MKRILNILFIIMLSACTLEEEERVLNESASVNYTFTLATEGHRVSTRSLVSAVNENNVNDLNAFIFDALTGKIVTFKYFSSAEMSNISLPMLISGTSGSRIFAFIANAGSAIGSTVANLTDLNGLKKIIMSGTGFL